MPAQLIKEFPITDERTFIVEEDGFQIFNWQKYTDYLLEQCQKRDELIEAQNELINYLYEHFDESMELASWIFEKKIETLKNELK